MLNFAFLCFLLFKVSAIILSVEHNYEKSSSVWTKHCTDSLVIDAVFTSMLIVCSCRSTHFNLLCLNPLSMHQLRNDIHAIDIQTHHLFDLNLNILRRLNTHQCRVMYPSRVYSVDGKCGSWCSNWPLRVVIVSKAMSANKIAQNWLFVPDNPLALLLWLVPICMFTLFVISIIQHFVSSINFFSWDISAVT